MSFIDDEVAEVDLLKGGAFSENHLVRSDDHVELAASVDMQDILDDRILQTKEKNSRIKTARTSYLNFMFVQVKIQEKKDE